MRPLLVLVLIAAVFCARIAQATGSRSLREMTDGAAVVREINLARQHPEIYAGLLTELRPQYHGKLRLLPGHRTLRTREGIAALNEAIRFLHRVQPMAPLAVSPGISMAAADHVAEQASGALGHRGSDSSSPANRMNRHGTWQKLWGENISYGKSTPREVVLALIIDDGLPARGHRKNIFNPAFCYAGAAVGPHARYRTVCSIDFAAGYVEAGESSRLLFAHY